MTFPVRLLFAAAWPTFVSFAVAAPALADNLYKGGNWPSLAADRRASTVGDLVTIVVLTNNSATNAVSQGSKKRTSIDGRISAGNGLDEAGGLSFGGAYDGQGSNTRANRMAAQLSATVTEVLPNGDLVVSGWQTLNISGERTNIRVSGRVRPEDIGTNNAVISSRLAEARIEYDGKGFASRSAKPGIVARIFNWLGLL